MFKVNLKLSIFMFILCVIFASSGWAEDNQFSGTLSCSRIGPRCPEYSEASGEVSFRLDENKQELSYELDVEKIKDVYMAHLHIGPCNKGGQIDQAAIDQGPIAAWLYPCGDHNEPNRCIDGEFTGVLAKGVIRPEDLENDITFEQLIEAMRNGNAYTNVHTRKYVTGEICGQIRPKK